MAKRTARTEILTTFANPLNQFGSGDRRGNGTGTHTFGTVKGWCTPSRVYIEKAFKPLGIRATYGPIGLDYEGEGEGLPIRQHQTVTVNKSQAAWADYVLGSLCKHVGGLEISNHFDIDQYEKGGGRSTIPMPWAYRDRSLINDDPIDCIKGLPKDRQAAAAEVIRKGRGIRVPGGLPFGHEGRQGASGGGSKQKRVKSTLAKKKRSTRRPRGAHRGAHRGKSRRGEL